MARQPRLCLPGVAQHIIQRGNNRQVCFAGEEDFIAYASWLHEYSNKFDVKIHAWVFMTNHVHLLVTPTTPDGVSKMMQMMGRYKKVTEGLNINPSVTFLASFMVTD